MSGGPLRSGKLQCYQGIDLVETRLFFAPPPSGSKNIQDVVPVDFTGAQARMTVRLSPSHLSAEILTLDTEEEGLTWVTGTFPGGPPEPAAPNGLEITISRTQSLAMNGGVSFNGGYYDVIVTAGGGGTTLLMAGQFDLLPTVTRFDL